MTSFSSVGHVCLGQLAGIPHWAKRMCPQIPFISCTSVLLISLQANQLQQTKQSYGHEFSFYVVTDKGCLL